MIYNKFIINDNIWSNFQEAFTQKKIPNAYIFFGDQGVGKEAHAIELSALLNCKRPLNNISSCGDCRSCIKIKKMQHEEIHFIHSFPILKSKNKSSELILDQKTLEEIKREYNKKSNNPYHKIQISNANTISINSIRNLKNKLFLSKSDENWSTVIIFDAEKLCIPKPEAANSLLKILEEPPEKTLFILVTSKINIMLPTILSRCQKIYFPKLSELHLKKYASENSLEINDEFLQMSDGSISNLLFNIDNNNVEAFKKLISLFYTNELIKIKEFQENIFEIKTKSKDNIYNFLDFLTISTKDLLYLSFNISSKEIKYKYLIKEYSNILATYPSTNWLKIINLLNESIVNLKKNININLELYHLLINVQYCLEGKSINTLKSELIK